MPTKINRAGQQQNYVPAGNGDASGEYGDNATGSNKNFKVFKKPEARTNELSKKQIKEIGKYANYYKNQDNKDLIEDLRYYGGTFGDLSGFTDEELSNIIDDLKDLKISDTAYYFKEGGKWKLTKNIGLLEKMGVPYYTKEQKDKLDDEGYTKTIEKSQTEQDKEMQKIMDNKCIVCFGKGYDKDSIKDIAKDLKTITDDFPALKDSIKCIGDKNSLEKYLTAINKNRELSEEEIQKEINRIKKYSWFTSNLSEETQELKYREEAIRNLKRDVKLTNLKNALAYWDPSVSGLVYMAKTKKWDDDSSTHSFNVNWHSSNKPNGVMCHELGHAIHTNIENRYKAKQEELKSNWDKYSMLASAYSNFYNKIRELESQNYNPNYQKEYNKLFEEKTGMLYTPTSWNREKYEATKQVEEELKNRGIKKYNMSQYATTNTKEFIAESFSAYYTDMKNPLANQVVEEFKKFNKILNEV